MTECEKKELIKSIALGMSFEDVAEVYGILLDIGLWIENLHEPLWPIKYWQICVDPVL